MQVRQGDLRDGVAAQEDGAAHAQGHHDEADSEYGVNLADHLVNGHEGGDKVIDQNHGQPEPGVQHIGGQHGQQVGRAGGEAYAHQHQEYDGEYPHYLLHGGSQIGAGQLRYAGSLVAHGHHAHHIVVDAPAEKGSEGDPQEHAGTPAGTCQSAEDRSKAGDVEQLDQKDPGGSHGNVVASVLHGDGRGFAVVGSEHFFRDFTVNGKSHNQQCQTSEETYHTEYLHD